jgi:hypothetical protein
MPPGTIAETSPGTVFLFAAMCTHSKTFSTLEPSIPYIHKCWRRNNNRSDMRMNGKQLSFVLSAHLDNVHNERSITQLRYILP